MNESSSSYKSHNIIEIIRTAITLLQDLSHQHIKNNNNIAAIFRPPVFINLSDNVRKISHIYVLVLIISTPQMEDAVKNPHDHQDLIVRLYGYSARFVTLDDKRQKEFMSRAIL